jgi:hypothetical protein
MKIISNEKRGGTLMNRLRKGVVLRIAMFVFLAAAGLAYAQNLFYMEVAKDGKIYVFDDQKAYVEFQQTGDIEKKITRIGEGPNGETMVFDSEEAIHLYNFKHNLPDEVIAKPEPPAPPAIQEKLPYKFSGEMFGDYFYNTSRDPNIATQPNVALGGPEDLNGFQFRRINFSFDDDLSPNFATRFRLEADNASLTSNSKVTVFVKDAWLQWKNVFTNNDLVFGIQPNPDFFYAEQVWGFRSLEKTILDLRGQIGSRDFGVALKGKLDANAKYSYWVMVGNNSGNGLEVDKFKRFYFNFRYHPNDKFTFTANEDIKQNAKITDPSNSSSKIGNNQYLTNFFVGYSTKDKYSLNFEAFFAKIQNGIVVGPAPFTLKSKPIVGYSAWGWYMFNPKVGALARFDYADPNSDNISKGDSRNFFLASLLLKPFKNVFIMPNVEFETYEKLTTGVEIKKSVTPRLTFWWMFP